MELIGYFSIFILYICLLIYVLTGTAELASFMDLVRAFVWHGVSGPAADRNKWAYCGDL